MSALAARRTDIHAPLALACALLVAGAALGLDRPPWGPLAAAVVAAAALAATAHRSDELRLAPLLVVAAAFQLALCCIRLAHGMHGDLDPRTVYDPEGRALLHGAYPHSPYPVGAVALFAVESVLGGSAHEANALAMVPFHLIEVTAVWRLRAPFVAACLALWPANAFFWAFRFDLVPAAAIALGVALAYRERWHAAGWPLGVGATVKWTPGLTAVALCLWLLAQRRPRAAAAHALGAGAPFVLANVPAFAVAWHAASAPYRAQTARTVTGESLPYLPLRSLGIARPPRHYYGAAPLPHWAQGAAAVLQLIAVAALVVLTVRAATAPLALARAVLLPAVFLLTNRIFSPQFFVVVLTCCACAAALTGARRVFVLLAFATVANAILFPGLAGAPERAWASVSALALLPAGAAVASLAGRRAR